MRSNSPVKIVHLSDLHYGFPFSPFGRVFDAGVLDLFANHIVEQGPDLIVASGDLANNPVPWQLGRARDFLGNLRTRCNLPDQRLIVLPGNHDVSFFGNIGYKPITSYWFDKKFPKWNLPTYFFDGELGIFVYWFDSNPAKFSSFARGSVTREELRQFSDRVMEHRHGKSREEREQFLRSFKIAVLHHHPMAVPYSGSDTYLSLNGAGDFLSEMAKHDIDLVVHGHKHFWGFSKTRIHPHEVDIRILAGGTAGRLKDQPRYNLITLLRDGRAQANVFCVPDGGTVYEEGDKHLDILNLQEAKTRAFHRSRQIYGTLCRSVSVCYDISVDGDIRVHAVLEGLKVEAEGVTIPSWPVSIHNESGYIRAMKAWMVRPGQRAPLVVTEDGNRKSIHSCRWIISLNQPLDLHSDPVTLEYEYWILNGLARTQEEARAMYEPPQKPHESVVFHLNPVTGNFALRVGFGDFKPDPETLGVKVLRPDGQLEESLSGDFREGVEVHDRQVEARIDKPYHDYNYEVQWPLPLAAGSVDKYSAARAGFLRDGLLGLRYSDGAAGLGKLVLEKLNEIRSELQLLQHPSDEVIDLSLMVWDEKSRLLHSVGGSPPTAWTTAFGDGLAGRALKLRKRLLYIRDQVTDDEIRYYISPDEAPTEVQAIQHSILLCEPVLLDKTLSGAIGVLSIGSSSRGSALYEFASQTTSTDREKWSEQHAADIVYAVAKHLLQRPRALEVAVE